MQAGISGTAGLADAYNLTRLDYPVLVGGGGEWDAYIAKLANRPGNVYNDLPGIAIIDQAGRIVAIHHGYGDSAAIAGWVATQVDALLGVTP